MEKGNPGLRAHYLQHVPFEGLGSIAGWLVSQRYAVTGTHFFDSAAARAVASAGSVALPSIHDVDLLVVMGGPMSVNDGSAHPWLAAEQAFIRRVVDAGTPVLGVCLGAQLIAAALGSRIYPNRAKEIGWFPVRAIASSEASVFRFPPVLEVFHWHGETFDLPAGSVRLARSDACENQAFQMGSTVIGLQFHLETTPQSAAQIVEHCRDELQPSQYVQSEATILSAGPEKYRVVNDAMSDVLLYLRGAGGR